MPMPADDDRIDDFAGSAGPREDVLGPIAASYAPRALRDPKRVRVSVPRLPGHLVEFGMEGPVVLYGPEFVYTATPKEGIAPSASAAELIAAVAEGQAIGPTAPPPHKERGA